MTIRENFKHHAVNEDQIGRMNKLREAAEAMAAAIEETTKPGREQGLAITNLEQALQWANKAIALEPTEDDEDDEDDEDEDGHDYTIKETTKPATATVDAKVGEQITSVTISLENDGADLGSRVVGVDWKGSKRPAIPAAALNSMPWTGPNEDWLAEATNQIREAEKQRNRMRGRL